jgi:hypothetical protein
LIKGRIWKRAALLTFRRICGWEARVGMTKEELAEALRSRLAERCLRGELDGTLPNGHDNFLQNLENTSHDNLIAGFLKCSVCGQMSMPVQEAVRFARYCDTADDWIKFLVGWQQQFGGCRHETDKPN